MLCRKVLQNTTPTHLFDAPLLGTDFGLLKLVTVHLKLIIARVNLPDLKKQKRLGSSVQ
ncbi:MAG: hypothetical protein JJU16_10490 [Alkalibacterium sp.]|nr:hypothetical protein [Alkalibacterium sp.]